MNKKWTLIAIGYWYSEFEPNLPGPQDFECKNTSRADRNRLVEYLDSGKTHMIWRGWSHCRYRCGIDDETMGHACLTDGKYIWPEGLSHYIDRHDVWLPQTFIEHAFSNENILKNEIRTDDKAETGDFTWWTSLIPK